MNRLAALDEINRLLDSASGETVNTSMRLPTNLRDAAAVAVAHLGIASSSTTLAASALRQVLETAVMEAALEAHYEQHSELRPTLAEVAMALAAQDRSPLQDQPLLLQAAAAAVLARHPDADAYDVLLWAEAQLALVASTVP